jgi:hypothetical protein
MLNNLPALLSRAAAGDEEMQLALLDEMEPLIFGYVRSLLPAGDEDVFERGVHLTHATALGILLDLRGGRVRVPDPNALRRQCHEFAVRKMDDAHPLLLAHPGDEESGMLTPVALELAHAVEAVIDVSDHTLAARRLRGQADATRIERALAAAGITRS